MANSIKEYKYYSNQGSNAAYTAPDYLEGREDTDIQVWVGDEYNMITKLSSNQYTINGTQVTINGYTLTDGEYVYIKRVSSPDARLTDYVSGSLLTADTLDADANQLFYLTQEALDEAERTNLAAGSFYHAGGSAPFRIVDDTETAPPKGTLWYDTSSTPNVLKVYDGENWDLAAPLRASYSFTTASEGYESGAPNNSPIDTLETNLWTPSSWVFLNGIKLAQADSSADIGTTAPASGGQGDYFYDTSSGKLLFKALSADDVLSIEVVTGGGSGTITVTSEGSSGSSSGGGGTATLDQATLESITQAVSDAQGAAGLAQAAADDAAVVAIGADLAAQDSNIKAVNNALQNVVDVSTYIANVNTVSGDIANVNTVSGDIANVNIVAGAKDNIDAVVINKTNIDAVAADIDNISSAGENIDKLFNKYDGSDTADSGTNTNISQIDTVANNLTNINTVATDTAKINSVGDDLVLGDSSNIKKVGENLSDVQAVGTYVGLELSSGLQWFGDTDNQASVETLTEATYKANIEAITTPEYAAQLEGLNEAIGETTDLWHAANSALGYRDTALEAAADAAADAVLLEDAINVKNTTLDAKDAAVLAANASSDKLNGWAVVDNNTISTYGSANTHLISSNTFEISAPDGVYINKVATPKYTYILDLDNVSLSNRVVNQYGNNVSNTKVSDGIYTITVENNPYASIVNYNSADDYQVIAQYQGNEFALIKFDKGSSDFTITVQKLDGTPVDTGLVFIQLHNC